MIIKNKDYKDFIKEIKQKYNKPIFDAIITDPPYNISRKNNFKSIKRAGIDFGVWDYDFDQTTWIKDVAPLIKNGATIIIFNDWKNLGQISQTLMELDFEVKDVLRWIKSNPMPRNVDRRYVIDYEFAIWAVKKGDKWTFNKKKSTSYLKPEFKHSVISNTKDKIHPTQKPIKLLEEIIKIHTNVNDLILDPFMGSGSTAIASLKNKRRFMGCEIDSNYFNKAKERINNFILDNKIIPNRSPLYHIGDKYKLIPELLNIFPSKINKFYDVFTGGGTILSNIDANNYLANDINNSLILLIKLFYHNDEINIIADIKKIIDKFNLNINKNSLKKRVNIESYNNLRNVYNNLKDRNNYEANIILLVLVIFGFNSQIRFNNNNEFNIPAGKQDFNKNREINLINFSQSLKYKNIAFQSENFDFILNLIKDNKIEKDDFFYFDPPYLITNATYKHVW
ncbi:hypothetical protein DSQ37_01755 [Ureaplasma urealyticum]|nr:hypothetical protein DSQ37_01755 [Ureaplasma urealyticum]